MEDNKKVDLEVQHKTMVDYNTRRISKTVFTKNTDKLLINDRRVWQKILISQKEVVHWNKKFFVAMQD
jgi:hypothetical protein